jgi:hypothetical protein
MNIKQLPAQMEISFWSTVIPLMRDTPFLRRLVPEFFDLFSEINIQSTTRQVLIWAGTGTILGFLTGLLFG